MGENIFATPHQIITLGEASVPLMDEGSLFDYGMESYSCIDPLTLADGHLPFGYVSDRECVFRHGSYWEEGTASYSGSGGCSYGDVWVLHEAVPLKG